MRTAAMTRIHRAEVLLEVWLSYYSRYFTDLVVFSCSSQGRPGGKFEDLKNRFNFELVELPDDLPSMTCHEKVFQKQRDLFTDHTWVLYSDADEMVVPDPSKYDGLRHFMDKCEDDQTFCEGYDVFQNDGEYPLDYRQPLLQQRKWWARDETKSYHKPLLSRVPTKWVEGFHYELVLGQSHIEQITSTGLYMVHMKHADPSREFDYSRDSTGTHDGVETFKTRAAAIPEGVRRAF